MSISSPNAIGIGLAPPESYKHREEQKKVAIRTMSGLQRQVTLLLEGTKTMRVGKNNGKHHLWNNNLNEILKLLEHSKTYFPPQKKAPSLPEQLKTQEVLYSSIIKKCQEIEKELTTGKNNKLKNALEVALDGLDELKNNRTELTTAIKEKTQKLEELLNQAKLYAIPEGSLDNFIYRMARSISSVFITEALPQSRQIDNDRITRYTNLKDGWATSSLTYDRMLSTSKQMLLGVSTLPAIVDHHKKLSVAQTMIQALVPSLQEASLSVIAKDFNDKFKEMRNLDSFKAAIQSHQGNAQQIQTAQNALTQFNSINDLQKIIEDVFKTTDEEVARLQAEYRPDFSLEDQNFQARLQTQRQLAIDLLIQQRDQIEKEWNGFCFAINEGRQAVSLLTRTKEYTPMIGEVYLEAEEMYQTLRHARKSRINRYSEGEGNGKIPGHEETFDNQSVVFLNLSQRLADVERAEEDGNEHAEPLPQSVNSFRSQCQKALIPEKDIQMLRAPASEEEAKSSGLVWSSDDKKAVVIANLKAQKARFAQESQQHNQDVRKAYEVTLPHILGLVRDELNTMGTVISTPTHEYDHRFNEAYFRATRAKRLVGNGVSTIASGLGAVATGAMSIWQAKPAAAELPAEPVPQPVEAAQMKREFKPFTSPLEAGIKL